MTTRRRILGCVGAAALFFAAPSLAHAADFRNLKGTLVHYYLTSSYNVRLDMEKVGASLDSFDLGTLADLKAIADEGRLGDIAVDDTPARRDYKFYLTGRLDRFRGDSADLLSYSFTNFGFGYTYANPKNTHFDLHLGASYVDTTGKAGEGESFAGTGLTTSDKLTFVNLLVGGDWGLKSWMTLGLDASVNVITDDTGTGQVYDADLLSFYGKLPLLNVFVDTRYDLGSKVLRDAEVGWALSLKRWQLGTLTLAYAERFKYVVTGVVFHGGFAAQGKPDVVVKADGALMARWERLTPVAADNVRLNLSGGLAVGTMKGHLRFAYAEAEVIAFENYGLYGRVGRAYARLEEESLSGGAAGVELALFNGKMLVRAQASKHDYDIVDRIGAMGGMMYSLLLEVGVGWQRPGKVD